MALACLWLWLGVCQKVDQLNYTANRAKLVLSGIDLITQISLKFNVMSNWWNVKMNNKLKTSSPISHLKSMLCLSDVLSNPNRLQLRSGPQFMTLGSFFPVFFAVKIKFVLSGCKSLWVIFQLQIVNSFPFQGKQNNCVINEFKFFTAVVFGNQLIIPVT